MIPVNDKYQLHPSESKKTLKKRLENRVKKMREGRVRSKIKPTLEKYLDKMEKGEDLALKMAYSFENLDVVYTGISEKEAKKKCEDMSNAYIKKSILPMIIYGVLCPVTFVIAPFIPVLNWGLTFYMGYKFFSNYRCIRGYNKILNSKFVKAEKQDLEAIIKAS